MRILLDQNIPASLREFLGGHRPTWTIYHVKDVGLWGAADDQILKWAQTHQFIVITYDEDFADARMYPVGSHAGVSFGFGFGQLGSTKPKRHCYDFSTTYPPKIGQEA